MQQYTWQNGPNDTSRVNAPTSPGGEPIGAGLAYMGQQWSVGSNETAEYSQGSDMVSVLDVFNGQTHMETQRTRELAANQPA